MFLYTKGTEGNPPEDLQKLLRYMENSCSQNAEGELLQSLHQLVQKVKQDTEVTAEYMKIYEREQLIREDALEEGLEKGLEKGREELLKTQIARKLAKRKTAAEIADELEMPVEEIVAVIKKQQQSI